MTVIEKLKRVFTDFRHSFWRKLTGFPFSPWAMRKLKRQMLSDLTQHEQQLHDEWRSTRVTRKVSVGETL
jgi:hypothetical protein